MEEKRLYPKQSQDQFGRVEEGAKYGFVDQSGEWVIEPKFDWADDFNYINPNKRNPVNAPVAVAGKQGRIRPDGSYLIEPIYDKIWGFKDGFAIVKKDGMWGYIKADGTYLLEPQFEVANEFNNGFALVKDRNGKWVKIDTEGNFM